MYGFRISAYALSGMTIKESAANNRGDGACPNRDARGIPPLDGEGRPSEAEAGVG